MIRLVSENGKTHVPQRVRDGIYSGKCMDAIFAACKPIRGKIRHVILDGAMYACWVEGFQEFLFDLLTNLSFVERLSVEPACAESLELASMRIVLHQFWEAYPERRVFIDLLSADEADATHLLCDLSAMEWNE